MSKKLLTLILSVVLILSFSSTVLAKGPTELYEEPSEESSGEIGLRLTYISSTFTNLVIDANGKANCTARIKAYNGVDSVKISGYLQKYDNGWKTVKHWSSTSDNTYFPMYKTWYVTKGLYRYYVYYYAYDGSHTETVHDYVNWNYN